MPIQRRRISKAGYDPTTLRSLADCYDAKLRRVEKDGSGDAEYWRLLRDVWRLIANRMDEEIDAEEAVTPALTHQ